MIESPSFELQHNYFETDTLFNKLKKELFTVVGLVDKIYREEEK